MRRACRMLSISARKLSDETETEKITIRSRRASQTGVMKWSFHFCFEDIDLRVCAKFVPCFEQSAIEQEKAHQSIQCQIIALNLLLPAEGGSVDNGTLSDIQKMQDEVKRQQSSDTSLTFYRQQIVLYCFLSFCFHKSWLMKEVQRAQKQLEDDRKKLLPVFVVCWIQKNTQTVIQTVK